MSTPKSTNKTSRSLLDTALDKAQKALQVGSEAADVLVHLQSGATPLGLAAVGVRMINSLRVHRARSPQEHFANGWTKLDLGVLESNAYETLIVDANVKTQDVPGIYEDAYGVTVEIDTLSIGFSVSSTKGNSDIETYGCWIPENQDQEETIRRVARCLWEGLKSPRMVATPIPTGERQEKLKLGTADEEKLFPSAKADRLYERLKKFLDNGYHRSVFIIGDPGVGKSKMLSYIARQHGGFELRIQLSDLDNIRPTTLARAVEILRPDVMIIDDFDRFVMGEDKWDKQTSKAAAMLDPIERINKAVPLFMVSANFSEEITEAMLRPERFDQLVILNELDPNLYEKLLPDAPPKVISELKRVKAPIAYVEELRKRVEVLGYTEAIKEMRDLMKRADRIINLNKKKLKGKSRNTSTLVGKSPRQRASILEQRAARSERKSGKLIEKAEKARLDAELMREKATEHRTEAEAREAKLKTKKNGKKPPPERS